MANQIDKIDVNKTVYNISAAPTATNTFTSGDDGAGNSWTNVATMANTDQNQTIFNKISTMFKNVRYLKLCLGSIVPSNSLAKQLSEKADINHTHYINGNDPSHSDFPVSNQIVDRPDNNSIIPTMDIISDMYNRMEELKKKI